MAVTYRGENPKLFQEIMGRGGAIPLGKRPVKQDSQTQQVNQEADEPLCRKEAILHDQVPNEKFSIHHMSVRTEE